MLDKSLPYLNILMKRSADAPDIDLQSYSLPQGYVLRPFAPADQAGWAEILESVIERPWLQWVAVRPAHQGKGIGAAMVARTIENALRQCGEGEVYLHTQTWSHAAVRLYKRLGFRIMTEPTVAHYDNSRVREALALLEEIGKRRREDSEAKPSF
jgi:GNAT superfamily N-acetyltransferase